MDDNIIKLIETYTQSGERLLALLRQLETRTWSRRRKEELLKQIDRIVNDLTESAGSQMAVILAEKYKAGVGEAIKGIIAQGTVAATVDATLKPMIHQRAVQAIMDEAFYSILEASEHMSADAKKRIADVVKQANERSLIEGVSRKKATKDAIADLSQRGITGMIAKNGAQIPADKYMAGVVQYHQRKAHVTGAKNMITQNGIDLVYVNYVGITCEYCATMQGRVYSVSGDDKRFPKLDIEPPYHSHCVHSVSAWIEEYQGQESTDKMISQSNRPFADNRTQRNIKAYERMQREKSRKNETRKQWIRYKGRLPNDTPSLNVFASQKARGTTKYAELQELYRKVGVKMEG